MVWFKREIFWGASADVSIFENRRVAVLPRPVLTLVRVVLPAPEGPMMASTWPLFTVAEMFERIFFSVGFPSAPFAGTVKQMSLNVYTES